MGAVKNISKKEFEAEITTAGKVLVDFYADWCGPCKNLAPILEELAGEQNEVQIWKINTDEETELAQKFGITALPTLLLFENGEVISERKGLANKAALSEFMGLGAC